MEHDESVRLFGPWAPRTPADAAALLADYPGRWWIAGGWAIETYTGVHREHGDVDPSIPRADVRRLREHLRGRLDVWAADSGTMWPLLSAADDALPRSCENLWLRDGGAAPWEYDVILMDATEETWTFKRDSRITRPLDAILVARDGIDYLRPEVQLLHKARGRRPKDDQDLAACLPLLDAEPRAWLIDALALVHPVHPWIARLHE